MPRVAVDDPDPAVVAGGDDAVTDGEGALAPVERVGAEAAGGAHALAGAAVEIGDVSAAVGDHQRLLAVLDRGPPVVHERRPRRVGGGRRHDPAMVVIGAGEALDVAVAQRRERVAVPRLVLAADLGQLERAESVGQRGEQAAGLDLGQLAIVADEHELGLRLLGRVEQAREVARADHAGLVDDQHRAPGRVARRGRGRR